MRKIAIVLMFLVLVTTPVLAWESNYASETITAIAWLEGKILNVGLANPTNSRTTVTISTDAVDSWGRLVFANRRIDVPARSIIVEQFTPATLGRNEKLTVQIAEGYRTRRIDVQKNDFMDMKDYIVPANTDLKFNVDLGFLLEDAKGFRLVIDSHYQTSDKQRGGPIEVTSFEGGLKYNRSSNAIEYARPQMVLSMKTPQTTNLTMMTFGFRKDDGYSWRAEEIPGPTIMVYGRNLRLTQSSSSGGGSGRVPR